jgi:hypothetical protein
MDCFLNGNKGSIEKNEHLFYFILKKYLAFKTIFAHAQ